MIQLQELLNVIHLEKMPKVKYGTKEYKNAYNERSLANYNPDTETYDLARPLPNITVTPKDNLDLGHSKNRETSWSGYN